MADQGYAVKVQFTTSSKVYEYFLPPDAIEPVSLENVRAVVDARGRTKIVRVVGIIPYEDRFFDGDLKPVIAIFDGDLLYEEPEEPREQTPARRAAKAYEDKPYSDHDDDIPF